MGDKTLLLADKLHINPKNFESLLNFVSSRQVDIVKAEFEGLPITAFGKYEPYDDILRNQSDRLRHLDKDDLLHAEHHGINLFSVCRAELLCLLSTQPSWIGTHYPKTIATLFERIFEENHRELLLNMAAAVLWIDFWKITTRSTPRLSYIGVFSGSLIYARALLEVAKFCQGRTFVFESFFTGQHYYCEERYDPIANRSDIRLDTVFRQIHIPLDQRVFESQFKAVLQLLSKSKNKNVVQPERTGKHLFSNGHPTALILGQVVNDFSLLEVNGIGISSIAIYEEMINFLLANTTMNIVFKAHPWEQKKANVLRPLTLNTLLEKHDGNPRIAIVESYAIQDLFAEASCVLCINSQSGIEAALSGFKPIQVGSAFWGRRGFSHDADIENLNALLPILHESINWRLTLDEFDHLAKWIVSVVNGWLVEETPGPKADRRLSTYFHEISSRKPTAIAQPSVQTTKAKLAVPGAAIIDITAQRESHQSSDVFARKLRKLVRRPDEFFRDSKIDTVRKVGQLLLRK